MSGLEKKFENEIKKFLESEGIYRLGTPSNKMLVNPCGYYVKRWGGAFTGSGLPDLQIVVNGKSIDLEVKAENGEPSELQLLIVNQINNCGGMAFFVYPKDFEFIKSLILRLKK